MVDVAPGDLNVLAIIVAAAVAYVLGALWYGPLFGTRWMRLVGKTKDELQAGAKGAYVISAVAWFASSVIVGYLLAYGGGAGALEGLRVAVSVGLAAVAMGFVHGSFAGKSTELLLVDEGYTLVGFVLIGLVLGAWP